MAMVQFVGITEALADNFSSIEVLVSVGLFYLLLAGAVFLLSRSKT